MPTLTTDNLTTLDLAIMRYLKKHNNTYLQNLQNKFSKTECLSYRLENLYDSGYINAKFDFGKDLGEGNLSNLIISDVSEITLTEKGVAVIENTETFSVKSVFSLISVFVSALFPLVGKANSIVTAIDKLRKNKE